MSRNQQREALERARQYSARNSVTRDEREQERRGPSRARAVNTGAAVKVNRRGQAVETTTPWGGSEGPYLALGDKQVDKINRKVERVGGSLTPGRGMAVTRFVTVRNQNDATPMDYMTATRNGGDPTAGSGGRHQLAIYGPVGGGRRGGAGGGRAPVPDQGAAPSPQQGANRRQAYNRAQSFLNSSSPAQSTTPAPGGGVEAASGFADRLSAFTGDTIAAMHQRARAGSYRQGRLLEMFAADLPKAPDFLSGRDLIDLANQANRRIQVS